MFIRLLFSLLELDCFDFGLHEVEPAEAEDERRRLLSDETGRLERLLDRSRNPMAAAPSVNFSDTFSFGILRNGNIGLILPPRPPPQRPKKKI